MQNTFIMIKPLGLHNFLLEIMARVRALGDIQERRLIPVSEELIAAHYAEHASKPFFAGLTDYYVGKTVLALKVAGPDVVARTRAIMGPSNPREAAPDQIRYLPLTKWRDGEDGWRNIELCTSRVDNLIHASDSPEAAQRELKLWGFSR